MNTLTLSLLLYHYGHFKSKVCIIHSISTVLGYILSQRYLQKYHYLKTPRNGTVITSFSAPVMSGVEQAEGLEDAVMEFQRFARLEVTGERDNMLPEKHIHRH